MYDGRNKRKAEKINEKLIERYEGLKLLKILRADIKIKNVIAM